MSKSSVEILEEMKEEDYESFVHLGWSKMSEEQWDFVIRNFEKKRKEEMRNRKKK